MLRVILILLALFLIYRFAKKQLEKFFSKAKPEPTNERQAVIKDELVQDPVSKVYVAKKSAWRLQEQEKIVYFVNEENKKLYLRQKENS